MLAGAFGAFGTVLAVKLKRDPASRVRIARGAEPSAS
jgi:hypothetical protein